ncbi:MAG: thiamine pyrophosphate-binding protein [Betaproteobacteria bacterium]|nr:MAG: thiamine pyrophosphate-binding protein [Betaproteobacteria bacterium]
MNKFNGAQAAVRMLDLYGVRHIFGLCGDTSLPFYDALATLEHRIAHILTRDERSAAYMADGYARVSGKPGVCEGPSGGGATYLLPGLVEANESSSPVLGITSDVPVLSRGHYPLTELDQKSLYRPLTKWNTVCDRADQVPHAIRSAFRHMTTGRPGAAHIGLPFDVLKQPVDPAEIWVQEEHACYPAWRSCAEPAAVEAAAAALVAARRPVFVCGGGVVTAGATEALLQVAVQLDAPVCTTVSGKGSIVETHPLSVGVVGSNGGVVATREVVQQADLVVFAGCRAGSTTTEHWTRPSREVTIVHIDVDPTAVSANYKTAHALVGDAKLVLEALLEALCRRVSQHVHRDGKAIAARARRTKFEAFDRLAAENMRPIRPERVLAELHRVLPRDAIVVADPGTPCPYVAAYYPIEAAGRHFITNRAHGALGYSMAAAMGAWFARPDKKCVSVMGDGSFGFAVGELETVVRYKVPLLMLVFSNASYGWIKASQRASYGAHYFSVDFSRTDHARIAADYGVRSWRVEDPAELGPVLRQAAEHGGPALVDVIAQSLEEAAAPVLQWMG